MSWDEVRWAERVKCAREKVDRWRLLYLLDLLYARRGASDGASVWRRECVTARVCDRVKLEQWGLLIERGGGLHTATRVLCPLQTP